MLALTVRPFSDAPPPFGRLSECGRVRPKRLVSWFLKLHRWPESSGLQNSSILVRSHVICNQNIPLTHSPVQTASYAHEDDISRLESGKRRKYRKGSRNVSLFVRETEGDLELSFSCGGRERAKCPRVVVWAIPFPLPFGWFFQVLEKRGVLFDLGCEHCYVNSHCHLMPRRRRKPISIRDCSDGESR